MEAIVARAKENLSKESNSEEQAYEEFQKFIKAMNPGTPPVLSPVTDPTPTDTPPASTEEIGSEKPYDKKKEQKKKK